MSGRTSSERPSGGAHGFGAVTLSDLRDRALLSDIRARASARLLPFDAAPDLSDVAPSDQRGDHVLNPQLSVARAAPPRAAAVLMVIAEADGEPVVLLTQRAAHLTSHPGQIALPGGKIEEGERPVDAALREAWEEVALDAAAVEPLGTTEPYFTRTGFVVVPVLGLLKASVSLRPDPSEVALIFTAPFQHVMTPHNYRQVDIERGGEVRSYHEIHSGPHRIWGVTAGILRLVEERIYRP